ncbi:hybrid sensor histidine kinase/response regulator [Rhodanobacter sp. C03]|uniref:hybrid sensor histidine kinase/response regulator n=1 Tax=Rhodanobacter sp. C03 TaxID=1945858 RepID=UPI00098675B3|nr:hybrid sensor histidine kinase/response regulator [Rhodanobacter sp. C03]OOG59770.1 hybrid sensor histidine kinase/response regulator [Rhodanobacter sp. C03]
MKAAFLLGMLVLLGALAPAMSTPVLPASASAVASLPASAAGPLPTPQFRRYSTADGLPSTNVYAVVEDRDGAIWFGTKGGLARFDGVDFEVFRHVENDPGSLYNNGIATLQIDRQGRLWAAGLNAGLNRYDATTGKFLHWGHDPAVSASLASDRVWAVAQTADGSLWVGSAGGLDRMRADGRGFEHVVNPLLGMQPADFGTVAGLYVDPQQRLWIGSDHGVFVRDVDGQIRQVLSDDPQRIMDVWRIDGEGDEVRIATTDGLMIVGKDGVAHRFAASVIPATDVMSSARDNAGRLWVGTKKGLFLQAQAGGPTTAMSDRPVLYGNLPGTWVWQLMVDREGGLWAAMYDGGVAYLAPGWSRFSRFTHIPDDPTSLRDSIATTMARGKDGRHVWVGERDGRIDRLDPVTGQIEHVLSGLRGDVVGMTEDARQRLWVAVHGALYRVADGNAEQVDPDNKRMERPLEVEPGPDGQMYVRTFGQGVFRIDPETLALTPVPLDGPSDKVLWGSQMTLRDGVFWYASDGGMMRLNAARDRFEMVPGAPAGQSVDAFDFSKDGVWMANADKLAFYRFRGKGLVLDRQIDAAHGWPSVNVTDLRVDTIGRVWIFGHDGLWYFDPRSGRFRSFGLQDGLTNGEFSRGYAYMPSGYIYAATLGGVAAFDPDWVSPQADEPQLSITRVSVRHHGVTQILPIGEKPLEIGWQDSQLEVEARVFSYVNPAANHYRFRLSGFDSGWVDTGDRGERDFSGLGAGDYTLDVMASGARGTWTHRATQLRMHVQAPPWTRWWAWLIYAVLVALLAWLLLLAWRRRLAHRHQIQLAEQRRSLAEQASAAKTQFLATLSHEIRTPMTGVLGMAELLQSTPLNPQQHDYTEAMQRSGSMLLKLLNDALDLARIEAGKLELELAPFDPRQLVKDVAQLERGLAQSRHVRFELDIADDLPALVIGDAVRIKQVLLNLANNALKFTERGSVTLRAQRLAGDLRFSISDTGPGISEASQTRLFQRFEQEDGPQRRAGSGLGLAICRELVSMMGGSIELQSQLGHGSTFHVRLPLAEPAQLLPTPSQDTHAGRHYRLLLVEDDTIVAAVIGGLLAQQGHVVVHVIHGLAALAELAQARFDAVLLDLDLPGVDGFQIARLIRQREPATAHMPIIAVTARSGSQDETRARAAGMDGFLRKPLTGEQLAAALAQVVVALSAPVACGSDFSRDALPQTHRD